MTHAHAPAVELVWTVGDRLRKARESAGFEQVQLAELIGVSRGTISNAERGKVHVRPILSRAWAMATGVPAQWLETGTAPADPPAPFVVRHQGLEPRTRWFSVGPDQSVAEGRERRRRADRKRRILTIPDRPGTAPGWDPELYPATLGRAA